MVRGVADDHGVRWEPSWGSGKIIEELFEKLCEDGIVRPTFVTGHPVEVSPLARVDPDDPELVRPLRAVHRRQRVRQRLQRAQRSGRATAALRGRAEAASDAGDLERGTVDEDYLRALEYGMPPTGGLGVGIDRLVMLLAGVHTIKEVILFPTLRPEPREEPMPTPVRRGAPASRRWTGAA